MLTKSRKFFTLAAVTAVSALSLAAPATAEDQSTEFTASQRSELEANMDGLGIDDATQQDLIEKLKAEGTIDALEPNEEPITTIPIDEPGFDGTIYVYEDGSRTKASLEDPTETSDDDGAVTPYGISECSVNSGSYGASMSGCLVKVSTIVFVGQFRADYTLVNGGNSYISNAYNWGCFGFGCTIDSTGIVKSHANLNGPAKAQMRVTVGAGPINTTGYVQLFAKGASAWTN